MKAITIKSENSNTILINVLRYSHPEANDKWDGNWLDASIELNIGSFNAKSSACLRADEFESFLKELHKINKTAKGSAEYKPMENWLHIVINQTDSCGNFCAEIKLKDNIAEGDYSGQIYFDQSYLPYIIRDIEDLLQEFPVK